VPNGGSAFLHDLQAYLGVPVFNPVTRPLADLDPAALVASCAATKFECGRFRASVEAQADALALELRVDELKRQLAAPESDYEKRDLAVRVGKLTAGIAKLTVMGPTPGETREKRDRADDAWCAIRGATRQGVLPGGGFALVKAARKMLSLEESRSYCSDTNTPKTEASKVRRCAATALGNALLEPVKCLYRNHGDSENVTNAMIAELMASKNMTYDIMARRWVDKMDLLDSFPAVMEAIRNSLSIASLLGTLGGIVAFMRDDDADRAERKLSRDFDKAIGDD
jgi:chaperonin GroEL